MQTIDPPASLAADASDMEKGIFKVDVSEYVKRCNRLRANLESAFTLILGQCNDITPVQLEGLLNWEAMDHASEVIHILNMVKSISHQNRSQMYHPLSLYLTKRSVYRPQQGPHTKNAQLVKKLKYRVEVVEEIVGETGMESKLVAYELTKYFKEIVVDPSYSTP